MTLENLRFHMERDDIWWRLLSCRQGKSRGAANYPIQHEYNYRHPRVVCRITCPARSYAPRKFLSVPACLLPWEMGKAGKRVGVQSALFLKPCMNLITYIDPFFFRVWNITPCGPPSYSHKNHARTIHN
jgi:hypothetical protein